MQVGRTGRCRPDPALLRLREAGAVPADILTRVKNQTTDVAAVFASYADDVRSELLSLRQLIFDTAAETAGVGAIEETLKWGQPSYLTSETRSGSTVRIAPTGSNSTHDYAMYFICHTNLIERFKLLFGDVFRYDAERGLLFEVGESIPEAELQECVAMALTYHLDKG